MEVGWALWFLNAAVSGIVGNRADASANHAFNVLVNHVKGGKQLNNQELEKALSRSFLSACQRIALECLKKLPPPQIYLYQSPSKRIYQSEQHKKDYCWLENKFKQLAAELKKVEKAEIISINSLVEIQSLLTPKHELTQKHIPVIRDKLLAEALQAQDVPECYKAKLEEVLFEEVCKDFACEIKNEPTVRSILEAQLMPQLNANLAGVNLTIEDLVQSISSLSLELQDLKKELVTVTNRSEGDSLPTNQESTGTSEGRLRIKLDITIEDFDPQKLPDYVGELRQLAEDVSIKMRRIQDGSVELILEGTQAGCKRIQALFNSGQLTELLGIRIQNVQCVVAEQTSVNGEVIQTVATLTRTLQEQEEFAKKLLKTCRREGYTSVNLSQILETVQQAYLSTRENIETAFRELLFPDTLAVGVKRDEDDEACEDDTEEVELDSNFINVLTEQVINFYN